MNNRAPATQITADKPLQIPEPFLSPALFQSLFWKPRFLVDTPLTEHLPLLFWLTSVIRPSQIGVVGADNGVAHFAFCQALDQLGIDGRCIGVGFWKNQKTGKRVTTTPPRLREHEDMLYDGLSQLTPCGEDDDIFDHIEPTGVDLLFCDLTALPDGMNVSLDELAGNLSRTGVLILHGVNHSAGLKTKANNISRFLDSRDHVRFLAGDGIVIRSKDDDLTLPLRALFEAAPNGSLRSDIEQVFRRCGHGVRASAATKASADALQRVEKMASEAQAKLQDADREIEALRLSHQQRSNKLMELQTECYDLRTELEAAQKAQAESDAALAAARVEADVALAEQRTELEEARVALDAAHEAAMVEADQRLEAVRAEADHLRDQLATGEEARVALDAAHEAAIIEAERSKASLQESLVSERATRFSETAILTRMAKDLRQEIAKLTSQNAELTTNFVASEARIKLTETKLKTEISNEKRVRFKETTTLTRMIEALKAEGERKKRPLEVFLIKQLVRSEKKLNKYHRNRTAFFSESRFTLVRAYFRLCPGK